MSKVSVWICVLMITYGICKYNLQNNKFIPMAGNIALEKDARALLVELKYLNPYAMLFKVKDNG